MHIELGLTSFQPLQQALCLACITFLAVLMVKLYNARFILINLKKQGLVSILP